MAVMLTNDMDRNIGVEEQMLLFYFMLTENEPFRVYVLSRTDPETLVRINEDPIIGDPLLLLTILQ